MKQLTIQFTSGKQSTYVAVPDWVYEECRSAESAGSYFNRYIRDHYQLATNAAPAP